MTYFSASKNYYLANQTFFSDDTTGFTSSSLATNCSCAECIGSDYTIKNSMTMTANPIKIEQENLTEDNVILTSDTNQPNFYTYNYSYYSLQSPLDICYENNHYFMTVNSTSSLSSPPPLLSPEFTNTELFQANEASATYYNALLDYPLNKIECYSNIKKETTATMNGNKIGKNKRHESPESRCSVSSTVQGKKKYSCHYCSRSFARKYDVARHQRIHTGSKPYVCPCCSKGFSRSDARVRHFRTENSCKDGTIKLGRLRNKRKH